MEDNQWNSFQQNRFYGLKVFADYSPAWGYNKQFGCQLKNGWQSRWLYFTLYRLYYILFCNEINGESDVEVWNSLERQILNQPSQWR